MLRLVPVFVSTFFLSIHFGAILYLNSALLGKFFKPETVSLLFLIGALGNIIFFLFVPKLIERFGKRLLLISFLLVTELSTLSLAFAQTDLLVVLSFVVYLSVLFMNFYCLDIFLEELSINEKTGEIRGVYLTIVNFGIALGPLVLALGVREEVFQIIYLTAALLLVPPIILSLFSFKTKMPKWHSLHHQALLPFRDWWQTKSVRRATLTKLVLEIFFAFMIIYIPIYLHEVLGFEWSVLGVMFTIMLLPFVLFQWPVGELADRFVGEKEFMIAGFAIMIITLLVMPYLEASVVVWTMVLFLSRVGASLVEVTSDSYFFKHVEARDTGLLSIFRLTRPASLVLGAAAGTLFLNFFSFEKLFFVLAAVVFLGFKEALSLRDTL
jgi:MFS family permease